MGGAAAAFSAWWRKVLLVSLGKAAFTPATRLRHSLTPATSRRVGERACSRSRPAGQRYVKADRSRSAITYKQKINQTTMYPQELVAPMKADLTSVGFDELLTVADVDIALTQTPGTVFLVFNSVCGCAAGDSRRN